MVRKVGTLGLAVLSFATGCQSGNDSAVTVVISLPEQHLPLATKATIVVDYGQANARLLSENGSPSCAFMLPGVDGTFADDGRGTLTIHASGPRATRGPADIAACRMHSSDAAVTAAELSSRLTVRIEAAEDSAGKPVDIAALRAMRHSDGSSPVNTRPTDADVEEAQAKAAAAAAAITKAARQSPQPNPDEKGPANSLETQAAPVKQTTTTAPSKNSALPIAANRQSAIGNIAPRLPGGAAPEIVDDSAMPGGDQDPSYDDSPADDDTVPSYSVDFLVQTAGTFGALQLNINHLGDSGGFIGRGDKVDCVPLVPAIVASNYLGERLTKIGLISLDGFSTPAKVMRCGFRTRESLSLGSFLIEVEDAADKKSKQIEPAPRVVVSAITPRY
jgi:hypothetical protein